ncbi:hypothetical protein [Nocardioides sp. MH1]|uniref:hypothetical protein n=1 Tax=Nocardioides sp. MH1 TaxID=3242490 RepID=UPI003520B7A0
MRKFLAKQGIDCKCGHHDGEHEESKGRCTAPDTERMVGSRLKGQPCSCHRYRPSLIHLLIELT